MHMHSIRRANSVFALPSPIQGSLSATPLIFIIPSACYLKLSSGRWFQGGNLIPCVLILIGFFVMFTGLTMTILYPNDCSHGVEMFYCADSNTSSTAAPVWKSNTCFYIIWQIICMWTPPYAWSMFIFVFGPFCHWDICLPKLQLEFR